MSMTRKEIKDKLCGIMNAADDRHKGAYDDCDESVNLATDLGLTSVSLLYIVIAVEEEFGIRFDNVGASDFVTLGDVVTYIGEKLN